MSEEETTTNSQDQDASVLNRSGNSASVDNGESTAGEVSANTEATA